MQHRSRRSRKFARLERQRHAASMYIVQVTPASQTLSRLTDALIRSQFSTTALEAGRIYEMRGRVLEFTVNETAGTIEARTQGSVAEPYTQRLKLTSAKYGALRISGQCSCPVGQGCKHLAAVLIALHRRQPGGDPERDPIAALPGLATARNENLLPYPITAWLNTLKGPHQAETEAFPPELRQRLMYVLDRAPGAVPGPHTPDLKIEVYTVALRKDGSIGNSKPYRRHQVNTPAAYLRPSDRRIMNRLRRAEYHEKDDDPVETLRRVIATERAFWGTLGSVRVAEGPPEPGQLTWSLGSDGSQQPTITLRPDLLAMRIPDPWYADPENGQIGPITFDVPLSLVRRLLDAPAIPAELAPKVREELARLPAVAVPPPQELPSPQRVAGPPKPHLRLLDGTLPSDPLRGRGSARPVGQGLYGVPLARLSFGYGPLVLPWSTQRPPRIVAHDSALYEPVRDLRAEGVAADRLAGLGFGRVSKLVPVYYRHAYTDDFVLMEGEAGADWVSLITRELPKLRDEGWTVEIDEAFPLRVVTSDSSFEAELIEGSGIDWLELHLGVQVDGERIDLVPALVRLLARPDTAAQLAAKPDGEPFVLPLPDGRLLSVPTERIRPIFEALIELHAGGVADPGSGKIGFSRLDAAELARFEASSGATWQGGEALRALGRQLREAAGTIPRTTLPTAFQGALRPYQAQGVDWLQFLRGAELGGILADDMGLGKTVQTLAHLVIEQAEGRLERPALIVCPTSLVPNWSLEAARFAPTLKVLALHGPTRKERFGDIAAHDLVLTTYPLLTRDHDALTAQDWHAVILDEAQTIKNPNAETTRQALRLKARQRLCLSGTPLQNHLGELWSLFDFLAPGFLGSQPAFRTRYRTPIEKYGDVACQERLSRRVRPFLLRRTKDQVIRELPSKTEITEPVEMEAAQRAIYEGIRLAMHTRVQTAIAEKGLSRSGIIILDALLKMRQACCDPRLLKLKAVERAKAGSAKLERLMEMLAVMLAEGRRILLFSQFTAMLALIERRLRDEGIEYELLTGDTKDRATPVKRFQTEGVPLFLISLKAGGVGLNLTAADTVIHYDPWWNPAAEDQATDRAHRIGQTRRVFVHRLVTLNTIEQKMETLKEKKRALVASVLKAEHGGALKLTEADIEALFAPGD